MPTWMIRLLAGLISAILLLAFLLLYGNAIWKTWSESSTPPFGADEEKGTGAVSENYPRPLFFPRGPCDSSPVGSLDDACILRRVPAIIY